MSDNDRTWIVLVPAEAGGIHSIVAGSGIVTGDDLTADERVTVDFEGNLYGAVNLSRWADRVRHAVDRAATRYPTVARISARPDGFVAVGTFDTTWGTVQLEPGCTELVARWIGCDVADVDAELTADSAQFEVRRELAEYARTHPAQARELARHGPSIYRAAAKAIGLAS